MNSTCRAFVALAVTVVAATMTFGQARNAFLDVNNQTDISITVSVDHLTYTLTLGPSPTFIVGSQTYHVLNAFSFFALSDTGANLGATGVDQSGWKWANTQSDVAGWTNNPKDHGVLPGHSLALAYTGITYSKIDTYGLHVTTQETFPGTTGNTGFVALHPVPEPGMVAGLMGAVGLLSLRMRRRPS